MVKKLVCTTLLTIMLIFSLSVFGMKGYAAVTTTTVSGGVNYAAVYNYDYYIAHNPDVKQAFHGDPVVTLHHFIIAGMDEGRQAIDTFDVRSYRLANPDLRAAYGNNLKPYYLHYLFYGKNEGRVATNVSQAVGATTKAGGIDYSAIYNYNYYIEHNPDVKQAFHGDDVAILNHFIIAGMDEGRQAIDTFDVKSYRLANPDLRAAYRNDLKSYYLHYLFYGKNEGRVTTGVFQAVGSITKYDGIDYSAIYNYNFYTEHNPDVKQAFHGDDVAILNHFIIAGMDEGRQAISTFDIKSYRLANPDLRAAYGNNLKAYYLHYLFYGKNEGRVATGVSQAVGTITKSGGIDYSAVYNYDYYVTHNPDIKLAFNGDDVATLNHFIIAGMDEGRQANNRFNVFYYKANYSDLQAAYGNNLKAYYMHYLNQGISEGRIANQLVPNYTGWWTSNGNKYYYENGLICKGWNTIANRNYYFSSSGILKSSSGIDVSSHNGKIDWQAVKNDGIEFAMIRVGVGDDLLEQDDSAAAYNMSECERLGIPYGVYLYSYALSDTQANSEAAHLLRMIKTNNGNPSLGVYLDVEDTSYYRRNNFDPYLHKNEISNFCKIVMTTLKNAGYKPGIYANYEYLNNIIDKNLFIDNSLWLAYWTSNKYPADNWNIWQYKSDGAVGGIIGNVDMDVMVGK